VNVSLVLGKRGHAVESAPAVLDAAEEGHLLGSTKQRTVHLALVPIEISPVLEAAATVQVFANIDGNVRRVLPLNTVSFFTVGIR